MPLNLQARLLRSLQERTVSPLGGVGSCRVNLAVICATNRKLRDGVATGRFREDLNYRHVLKTALALLGDGQEITVDEHFLEQAGYSLKRGVLCEVFSPESRSDGLLADAESRFISSTLDRTGGNIAAAARIMGIGRSTLYRKLRGPMGE